MLEDKDKIEYLDFVQAKLKYIERYTTLIKTEQDQLVPAVLNHALAAHNNILNWLISEYEKITIEYDDYQEDFKMDMDEWNIEAAKKIKENSAKSKYPSNSEIEANARVSHREEYIKHKRKLLIYERKVSFYRRIMESWAGNKSMLENLSWNSRTEMKALPIEDYANKDMNTEIKRKILPEKSK